MEDEIVAILKEEKIEKDLRLAEMEANKAQIVMLHQVRGGYFMLEASTILLSACNL